MKLGKIGGKEKGAKKRETRKQIKFLRRGKKEKVKGGFDEKNMEGGFTVGGLHREKQGRCGNDGITWKRSWKETGGRYYTENIIGWEREGLAMVQAPGGGSVGRRGIRIRPLTEKSRRNQKAGTDTGSLLN